MSKLQNVIQKRAPFFISPYRISASKSIRPYEGVSATYRVALGKLEAGSIWGFDLSKFNNEFMGPTQFISPLSIGWGGTPPLLLFDSQIHGYHAELGSSAKLRGEGNPEPFVCAECKGTSFKIFVQMDYMDACEDILDDEPDIEIQDYFTNILIAGECVKCGTMSTVLDMDL